MDARQGFDKETYRQGYLQRKKAVAKSVKKRWFCLNSDAFITFRSEEDARMSAECLEVLPLVDVQTVKKQHTSSHKHYPFEIITLQKTHVFLTDSAYEQDQWVKAFHEAMKFRCFNTHKTEVASKYANGKDRRSSTGSKKLSQIKKKVQDGLRSGGQRKSSGVECDLGETPDYQGISIGHIENDENNDDVFATNASTLENTNTIPHGKRVDSNDEENYGQSRASDDSGQGSHDVRNMDSSLSTTIPATIGEIDKVNDSSVQASNGTIGQISNGEDKNGPYVLTSTPPPVPAPSGLSRSKKRVFADEQIYDTPPMIDEELYDVPPREQEQDKMGEQDLENYEQEYAGKDEEFVQSTLTKSSAMDDLQKILDEDSEDDDQTEADDGNLSEYENVHNGDERDSLEAALAEKGVERSAVDQLKDLLDSFDEL